MLARHRQLVAQLFGKRAVRRLDGRQPVEPSGLERLDHRWVETVALTRNARAAGAHESGPAKRAIARLEAGNITPSLPTLDKIAAALGAEVSLTIVDLEELAGSRQR